MVERLAEFVVPYQHVLETEAGQRNVYLYLQGRFCRNFYLRRFEVSSSSLSNRAS
jgi:hypothetical protein